MTNARLTTTRKPYIEFEHVTKAFGSKVVLDDVSFDVMPGETVCILGRSGVGKSVSLHQHHGLSQARQRARLGGLRRHHRLSPRSEMERIRKKVTMVFQNGALFDSLTVGENVAFPLRERGGLEEEQIYQIIDGLLDMVGVREFRDLLPSDLSTGMKRSVAIARALAAQPDAVLYDEPTTMVDPLMAHLLGDLIKKLKKQLKLTSIVVTHDMALAKKLADRLVFLHEARVIFFGTFAEMAQVPRSRSCRSSSNSTRWTSKPTSGRNARRTRQERKSSHDYPDLTDQIADEKHRISLSS